MKYILEPTLLRTNIQVYRKGLKYKVIVARFNKIGDLTSRTYYETFFSFKVRKFIVDVLDVEAYNGIGFSEIEIYNYTKMILNLGIKTHNLR